MISIKLDRESKLFIKNSRWLLSSNTISAIVAFVKSILIARGLGVELFGSYVVLTNFIFLMQEFFDHQIGSAIIKFGAEYKTSGKADELIGLIHASYLLSLIMAGISIISVSVISIYWYRSFIEIPGLTHYIIILSIASGLTLLDRPSIGILRLYSRFKINSIVNICLAVIDLTTITFVVLYWSNSLTAIIIAASVLFVLQMIVNNVSMYFELREEVKFFSRLPFYRIMSEWRKIWYFVIGTSGSNTIKKFINRGDVLILSALVGSTQVGYYAIAKKMASVIKLLTDPLSLTIYPQVASLIAEHKFTKVLKMLRETSFLVLLPLIIMLVLLFYKGEFIIQLAYGPDYIGAVHALLILMAATAIEAIFFWNVSLLNSLGLVAIRFTVYGVSALIGFATAISIVPAYGAVGMGLTLLLVNCIIQSCFLLASVKKISIQSNL